MNVQSPLKTLVASVCVLALALVLGGCGRQAGSKSEGGASKGVPSASAVASDNPVASGGGSASPSPGKSEVVAVPRGPCSPRIVHSRQAGHPGVHYIRAATTPERRWGRECDRLDPGDECAVQFNVAYTVAEGPEAFVEFQAWVPGRTEPVKTHEVGPLPPVGEQGQGWPFPTTIPQTKEIAFRLVLKNSQKVPVAISDAYVYKVGCRAPVPS